ncbi:unnamed protein product [Effrenium voratum]|uniref:Rhodanese domain-containing protein n=1 Tax=Effrenium voratum TaxID=2562239 RepID=A0AA36HLI8_9DINO|nr:unnamed protein product [Effrenium voratum]
MALNREVSCPDYAAKQNPGEEGVQLGVPAVPKASRYHLVTSHAPSPRGMYFDSEGWLEAVQEELPDKETKIVVGCAGGVRSKAAAQVLEAAGYVNVQELDDGFNGWVASGLPVAALK